MTLGLRTLLKVLRGSMNELKCGQLESTPLKTADDVADESTLDTIGLKQVVCTQNAAENEQNALHIPSP